MAASQVIHLLSPLQTNSQIIKQINDLFFVLLWNNKGDKIKRNVIIVIKDVKIVHRGVRQEMNVYSFISR